MREKGAITERSVARIAGNQHGVVSTAQLLRVGLTKDRIRRFVIAGRLHPVHRGVYAVGHSRLSFEGRCGAAALALGGDAAVSHRSAAALWGLLPPSPGPIEVSVPSTGGRKRRKGIVVHRPSTLNERDLTRRSNVPVTKPLRTLRDLRRLHPAALAQRAQRRALDLGLVSESDLGPDPDLTRSELERMFLRLCRRHRVPAPDVNARVAGLEVDFLWREARVIVETDGFRHHGNRDAFEADRERDAELQSRGYRVLRFSYRQVSDSPGRVAAAVRVALERASPRAG